jgi:hypothetical protein
MLISNPIGSRTKAYPYKQKAKTSKNRKKEPRVPDKKDRRSHERQENFPENPKLEPMG